MDINSFVETIIANPGDDVARLIFADFLEEHEDPRAELIRLQFQIAELGPFDKQRQKLRTRELQLLKKHGGFGRTPGVVKVLATHGGFVDAIEVTVARFLKLQEEIFTQAPIRELHLRAKSAKFDQIRESRFLQQLQVLSLRMNEASRQDLIRLIQSPNLKNLRRFELRRRDTSNETARAIAEAPDLAGLKELFLYGPTFGSDGCQYLAESQTLTNLEQLDFRGRHSDASLRHISSSPNFTGLKHLRISGDFSRDGVNALQQGIACRELESLMINRSENTEGLNFEFAEDTVFQNLKHLAIGGMYYDGGVGDETVRQIVDYYPHLEWLDLSQNRITDVGASYIANSPLLGTLKKLLLTGNSITVSGIREIAESPHRRKGLKLYLRSNRMVWSEVQQLKADYGSTFGNMGKQYDWPR